MRLAWHIVRKDLARLTIPLGLWIAFVAGTTAWFGVSRPPTYASTADILSGWVNNLHGFGLAGVMLQATVGALLAAVQVLEDPPVGTTAFWLTRPVSGARLLAAKFAGAGLFFALMPAAALMVVWLGLGFSWRESGLAALEFVGWQLVVTVPVLAVGVTTGNLGRFVFVTLGLWLLVVATVVTGEEAKVAVALRNEWIDSRGAAIVGTLVLGAGLVFSRSYLGRRRRAWVLSALTLALMVGVRAVWERRAGPGADAAQPAVAVERGPDWTGTEELALRPIVQRSELRLAGWRMRVLGEMPLLDGAEMRAGSERSRLVNLGWNEGRSKRRMVLQERDARLAADYGVQRNTGEYNERRSDVIKADAFFLVNRARGYACRLEISEIGTARMNSLRLTARIMEFAPVVPIGADFARWDEGATIVKVRCTREGNGAPSVGTIPGNKGVRP